MNKITKKFIKFAAKDKYMEKERGRWCVRCALGKAKSDFDDSIGEQGLSISQLLKQVATGIQEVASDKPLVEARDFLASLNWDLLFDTKKEAINFMLNNLSDES